MLAVALSTLGLAFGQERFNYLAVGGQTADRAGPYYFIAYGDSRNAYAQAEPFARAMNVELKYRGDLGLLIFERPGTTVEIRLTRDIPYGLERGRHVVVNDQPYGRDVPQALLVDGTSYVPITPIVDAFGGTSQWIPDGQLIDVRLPPVTPPSEADTRDPQPEAAATGGVAPRLGFHGGYTRIAIDVPDASAPRLVIPSEGVLTLLLPDTDLAALDVSPEEGPLVRAYSDRIGGSDALMLIAGHPVAEDGTGFRIGRLAGGTVYVDVGPGVRGEALGRDPPEPVEQAAPAPAEPAPPVTRRQVVVLDAGHGAHDPGTVSPWAQEKNIVLSVAAKVRERLEREGIKVVMTRDDDTFLSLQQRSTFATTERNLFVSIHANAAANTAAQGIETWVFGQPLEEGLIDQAVRENGGGDVGRERTQIAAEDADIAGDILRESQLNYSLGLAETVQQAMVDATGANDRGVRQNLFYVIRNSRIPAVLIELGFVSHPEEGRRLLEANYQNNLADAIAGGIVDFLRGGGRPTLASGER